MKNANHPRSGQIIRVEPIRSLAAIDRVRRQRKNSPRDLALFDLGVNTNIRASDMLNLTVGQVKDLSVGDQLSLREKKTQKVRNITINRTVYKSLQSWLTQYNFSGNDAPLFPSHKTGEPLKVPSFNNMIKSWCRQAGLKGNYGSHTLRKTFGYVHRTVHKTDIPTLMMIFNHSTQKQTLDYLCIQQDEINGAYLKEI